jgi:hypothetical protein
MNIKIKIERKDGVGEPWTFTETKYESVSIARETISLMLEKFNDLASHLSLPLLKDSVEMVPLQDERHAQPNAREAQRLANQPKR